MRVLIHPTQEPVLFEAVTKILDTAIIEHPDTFDRVVGKESIVDHYGYHTAVVSSVVLTTEPFSQYYRLTIKHGTHPVYDRLMDAVVSYYGAPVPA